MTKIEVLTEAMSAIRNGLIVHAEDCADERIASLIQIANEALEFAAKPIPQAVG